LTNVVGSTTVDTPTYLKFCANFPNSGQPVIQTHSTPVKEPRRVKTYVNVKVAWP
jgi:hypothetical protein